MSPVILLVQEVDVIVATENNISASVMSEPADTLAGSKSQTCYTMITY